ncbi:hypothetical protein HY493_00245 [Candidatus Woesearchaeota archaeon]|nr:hypothetical protein [Candidatus Woesearchaeota archaeon]
MKSDVILTILLIFIAGCARDGGPTTVHAISGTPELVLDGQDLQQIGIAGTCRTEEYQTDEHSPLAQYSFCNYSINSLTDTEVVLELKKFTDFEDLNGTYQYESLHLRGFQGLISEDGYGDLSRFYVNNESTVYYYHLWIVKNEYLIHITSKGSEDAGEYIEDIGRRILSKFVAKT